MKIKGKITKKLPRSNRERGFSVSEILIVLVVSSILVATAIPKGIESMRAYRLETGVSTINQKLMEARMDAIKRNRTSWLTLDKIARTAQVRTTDGGGATINVGSVQNFPQGIYPDPKRLR